jgi:hypothetical protein
MQTRSRHSGKGNAVVLGLFLLALAAGVAIKLLKAGDGAQVGDPPAPPAPTRHTEAKEFCGFTLQLQSGWEGNPYETYIDQIAATGVNTVSFVIAAYQENASSSSIFLDLRRAPSDERLRKLIAHARSKGLNVTLMPIVLLDNARTDEWRGKIEPEDWDHWWSDYRDIVLRYARISRETGVSVFLVGSELLSTESQTDKWRELIADVREIYSGRLAYSANWDHYRPIEWWDALDIVGMTTYYDLTKGETPTVERLMDAWKPIREEILSWQTTVNRPILFTEVGWPNQTTCAEHPWNYFGSTEPAPQAQANCFEAFFRTWADEPIVAGFVVWEWQNHPEQTTGPEDTGYNPAGKPAMKVIERYFALEPDPQAARNLAAESAAH